MTCPNAPLPPFVLLRIVPPRPASRPWPSRPSARLCARAKPQRGPSPVPPACGAASRSSPHPRWTWRGSSDRADACLCGQAYKQASTIRQSWCLNLGRLQRVATLLGMSGGKRPSGKMRPDEAARMREVTDLIKAGRWHAPDGGDPPTDLDWPDHPYWPDDDGGLSPSGVPTKPPDRSGEGSVTLDEPDLDRPAS
jgi:hypothetical protein